MLWLTIRRARSRRRGHALTGSWSASVALLFEILWRTFAQRLAKTWRVQRRGFRSTEKDRNHWANNNYLAERSQQPHPWLDRPGDARGSGVGSARPWRRCSHSRITCGKEGEMSGGVGMPPGTVSRGFGPMSRSGSWGASGIWLPSNACFALRRTGCPPGARSEPWSVVGFADSWCGAGPSSRAAPGAALRAPAGAAEP